LETNRVLNAAIGWLIAVLVCTSVQAQEISPDTLGQKPAPPVDSSAVIPVSQDTIKTIVPDSLVWGHHTSDSNAVIETVIGSDTIKTSRYNLRTYLAKSIADEIKGTGDIFLIDTGPIGAPAIPLEYLNVAGTEISVNGMPFLYNGIYRPYVMGTDLNVLPWEILNDIAPSEKSSGGLDFQINPPTDRLNRSDVEIGRGPYNFNSSRWRFSRPFGAKTLASFTAGFCKSDGLIENSDFNSNYVTAGMSYEVLRGTLSVDLWRHRTRTGLNSFDFLVPQLSRQSRGIDRGEVNYSNSLNKRDFLVTAIYQRSAQTISGYSTSLLKSNYDIAGGKIDIADTAAVIPWSGGVEYYKQMLYSMGGSNRRVNDFRSHIGITGDAGQLNYDAKLFYLFNSIDKSAVLPSVEAALKLNDEFALFGKASRTRMTPDLLLLNLDDNVTALGVAQVQSYHFICNPDLEFPVTTDITSGIRIKWLYLDSELGVSFRRIDSQISLSFEDTGAAHFIVSPYNFDDKFTEYYGKTSAQIGPVSGELWGAYRIWSDKYYPDGLEKGPQALGFGRVSFERNFFVPRLFLGGSLEMRAVSRRDYRSLVNGFTDAFISLSGRFEFRYKDVTFWLNDDNIANSSYVTWWPYYKEPRTVWWGLRWLFFD
jgi:hypothetical protein